MTRYFFSGFAQALVRRTAVIGCLASAFFAAHAYAQEETIQEPPGDSFEASPPEPVEPYAPSPAAFVYFWDSPFSLPSRVLIHNPDSSANGLPPALELALFSEGFYHPERRHKISCNTDRQKAFCSSVMRRIRKDHPDFWMAQAMFEGIASGTEKIYTKIDQSSEPMSPSWTADILHSVSALPAGEKRAALRALLGTIEASQNPLARYDIYTQLSLYEKDPLTQKTYRYGAMISLRTAVTEQKNPCLKKPLIERLIKIFSENKTFYIGRKGEEDYASKQEDYRLWAEMADGLCHPDRQAPLSQSGDLNGPNPPM